MTTDTVESLGDIRDALVSLGRKPTVRVVFDYPRPAREYRTAVETLHQVAFVLGQPLDSSYAEGVDCRNELHAAQRAAEYVADSTMVQHVDVWEIGNEVNGEWLCRGQTDETYLMIREIFDVVKAAGKPAVLTLFWYSSECVEDPRYEMLTWVDRHVEDSVRMALDYVLVSVYETACPAPPSWAPVFYDLAQRFPHSWLGFGEVGTEDEAAPYASKLAILDKYYGLAPMHPRFVGGFFWWYFFQDMVPKTKPLWAELEKYSHVWEILYP